jgi:hypothetical protein
MKYTVKKFIDGFVIYRGNKKLLISFEYDEYDFIVSAICGNEQCNVEQYDTYYGESN